MLKINRKSIAIWIGTALATILLLLLFLLLFHRADKNYDIVILGDSIIGKNRTETSVSNVMQQRLGKTVFNGAFGGSCMSIGNTELRDSYQEDSLNMAMLVDGICYQDFSVQKSDVIANRFQTEHFEEIIQDLSEIDFHQVDTVIIEHGTNDYNGARPIDNPENPYDIYTFAGALRYTLETFQKEYPELEIILVTPSYCWLYTTKEDCLERDFGYGTIENYVEIEKQIAKEYQIPVIDSLHGLGINKDNIADYETDGLHLNDAGCILLGNFLADELEKIWGR